MNLTYPSKLCRKRRNLILNASHLNENVGAEDDLEGVVEEEELCALDRLPVFHELRAPHLDQVNVQDAGGNRGNWT